MTGLTASRQSVTQEQTPRSGGISTPVWRAVPGYEGLYDVSADGRVWSVRARRDLKPCSGNGGYLRVNLTDADGNHRGLRVHHLVLVAFVGPRPVGMVACHSNDVPTDNRLGNLRWDTPSENEREKVRNGHHHHARKTDCIRGHLLADPNLRNYRPGKRECLACARASTWVWRHGGSVDVVADQFYARIMAEAVPDAA